MRFLALLPLLFVACNSAEDRLIGTWEFDEATYELIQRYRSLPADEQRHWVETAKMDVTFTEDRISWEQRLPGWGNRSAQGYYSVVDTQGNRADLSVYFGEKEEKLVVTVQENRLRFSLSGRSIILRRVATKESTNG